MKCGGNASFQDFMSKHPGAHSYSTGNSTVEKYSSRTATLYKEELAKRVSADEAIFGKLKVVVDGSDQPPTPAAIAAAASAAAKNDDFFDTWDSAPPSKPAQPTAPVTGPASFGLTPPTGTTPNSSRPASPRISSSSASPPPTVPAAPRTVTSSSLRTSTTSSSSTSSKPTTTRPGGLGATRSISSSASGGTGGGGTLGGRGKLGVKKTVGLNFEEAEKKAKEEEERVKRLGYDSKTEEVAAAAAVSGKSLVGGKTGTNGSTSGAAGKAHVKKDSVDTQRLGMGMKRLGFGQVTGIGGEQAAKEAAARAKAEARKASGYDDDVGMWTPLSLSPFIELFD